MNYQEQPLRVMSIMAHQDDFEFNAGGTFALLRQALGDNVRLCVLTTTTGASGHHTMTAAETVQRRDAEARAAAAMIGAEYHLLKTLDNKPVEDGQFLISRSLLGGLWNAIR